MRSLKRLGLVLWLALALVAGQQLVLWHDLGHAAEAATQDDGTVPAKCEQHSACVQLAGGALGVTAFVAALVDTAPPRAAALRPRATALAPRRAFLSRAPPASLG